MGCSPSGDTKIRQNLEKSYKLDSKLLGSGSYAKVYRAKEIKTGKMVAVKRISKAKSKREYLDVEIAIMRQFGTHKHIVTLFACYETETEVQLVIEYMSGGELFEVLNQNGPYGEADAAHHLKAIGSALSFLHGNNVAHRDLKPENLLLSGKPPALGVLKLSDFGLAKVLKENELMHKACGTWAYCAPEVLQIRKSGSGQYGVKCDMFSVGVLMFVILAGYHPFDADGRNTDKQMQELILAGTWDFDDDAWEQVSEEAKDLIRSLLALDPSRRFSAVQMLKHSWTAGITPYGSLSMKIDTDLSQYTLRMKQKNLKAGLISTQAVTRLVLGHGRKTMDAAKVEEDKIDAEKRAEARRRWKIIQKAHKSGEFVKQACATLSNPQGKTPGLGAAVKAAHHRFLRFQATPNRVDEMRQTRVTQLFRALDVDRNGWLNESELFRFAKHMGFPGDKVKWNTEYVKLCVECNWDNEAGIDDTTFELLVNTKECNFYHTNHMLDDILEQLAGQGTPQARASSRPSSVERSSKGSAKSKSEPKKKKTTVKLEGKPTPKVKSKAKASAKKDILFFQEEDSPKREASSNSPSAFTTKPQSKKTQASKSKGKLAALNNDQPGPENSDELDMDRSSGNMNIYKETRASPETFEEDKPSVSSLGFYDGLSDGPSSHQVLLSSNGEKLGLLEAASRSRGHTG